MLKIKLLAGKPVGHTPVVNVCVCTLGLSVLSGAQYSAGHVDKVEVEHLIC